MTPSDHPVSSQDAREALGPTCDQCGNSGPGYDPVTLDRDGITRCLPCAIGWRLIRADSLRHQARDFEREAREMEAGL